MTACSTGCGRTPKRLRRSMCNACYQRDRYRLLAYQWRDDGRTDAEPVRAHVLAVRASGMALKELARRSGVPVQTIRALLYGTCGKPPSRRVAYATADRLLAVAPAVAPARMDWVPVLGSQRRLRALVRAGHPIAFLAAELGTSRSSVWTIARGRQEFVRGWRHKQIVELFSRLQLVPGRCEKARAFGKRLRWALPLQWDEDAIDDPGALPAPRSQRYPDKRDRAAA